MSEAIAGQFDFLDETPKREPAVMSAWDELRQLSALMKEKGMMVPTPLAARVLGVSVQRVHQFIDGGSLEVVRCGRSLMVTEKSLLDFAKVERKNGRPFKPGSVRSIWQGSQEYAANFKK